MLKKIKQYFWIGVIILIIVPVCIYALSVVPLLPSGTNNDWAGFWGGYLGAIIGGLIALYVMKESLKKEDEHKKEDDKAKYFGNIIKLVSELRAKSDLYASAAQHYVYRTAYLKKIPFNSKEFAEILMDIEMKIYELEIMLEIYKKNYVKIDNLFESVKKIEEDLNGASNSIDMYDTQEDDERRLIDYKAEAVDLKAQDIKEHVKELQEILLKVVKENIV